MKKDYGKIAERLENLSDKLAQSKTGATDKKMLEGIGKEKIKRALDNMSLNKLYTFLHRNGYKGNLASLRDNLQDMDIRKKEDVSDKFASCKCRKAGCDGRLEPRNITRSDGTQDRIVICAKCGARHAKQGRKIVVVEDHHA